MLRIKQSQNQFAKSQLSGFIHIANLSFILRGVSYWSRGSMLNKNEEIVYEFGIVWNGKAEKQDE